MKARDNKSELGKTVAKLLKPSEIVGRGMVDEECCGFLAKIQNQTHLVVIGPEKVSVRRVDFPELDELLANADGLLDIVPVADPDTAFGIVVDGKVVAFSEKSWDEAMAIAQNDSRIGMVANKEGTMHVERKWAVSAGEYAGSN